MPEEFYPSAALECREPVYRLLSISGLLNLCGQQLPDQMAVFVPAHFKMNNYKDS